MSEKIHSDTLQVLGGVVGSQAVEIAHLKAVIANLQEKLEDDEEEQTTE